jgi:hypothetical protein
VDIAHGEAVESELRRLIEKRHDRRVAEEGERQAGEIWMDSERRYDARRRAENGAAWLAYHEGQAARHRGVLEGLVAYHEAEAESRIRQSIGLRGDGFRHHSYPEREDDLNLMRVFHAEHGVPPSGFFRRLMWRLRGKP